MFSTIQAKIVVGIILVLVVSMSLATVLTVRSQRTNLLEARLQDVANNSNTLNISVRNVMLAGEAAIAVDLLEDLSTAPGFRTLEVYRTDGSLAFSDYETIREVNENLGVAAFSETPRRMGESLMTPVLEDVVTFNTPRVEEDLGAETLEYYFPILNYQECRECHGSDHFVRGVAYYDVSLASVFERITTARNSLLGVFAVMGGVVAAALVSLMQRTVVQPILRIGTVVSRVGDGDLDVQARVAGSREFETLSNKINGMIEGLKERNRLEIENSVIDARDQENRKYLDNIAEGLILIDRDLRISRQYSRYVETLFGTREVAGRGFSAFVYPDSAPDSEERLEVERFLTMIFENTTTEMEMIMSINPLSEKTLTVPASPSDPDGDKRNIVFGTVFQRVFGEDDSVERVMAIFEDRTDIARTREELEAERQRYKSDIEHIATLLRTGPDAYADLERSAADAIDAVEHAISTPPTGDRRNALMRDLHSLKGTARYLEFQTVAELAHEAEELIGVDRSADLGRVVEKMREEMSSLSEINEKFRAFATAISPDKVESAALESFLSHITRMTNEIADQLGKEVEFRTAVEVDELPQLSTLRNPLIHLIRNAIDHGVEDQYERLSSGKSGSARITLSIKEKDEAVIISVADDGKGIDFDEIRKVGVERGVLEPDSEYTEQRLIQTLFSPSFSTRENATDISGRGVGLDVVQDEVRALGGKISVGTKRGSGTRFTITVPKETKR